MPPKKEKEKNQHIQVVVRCRPVNGTEKKQGAYSVVDTNCDRREVHIKERAAANAPTKTYTFDRVFGPQAKQIELYKTTVVPIIEEVLLGYNCTIFAYGQTGTGKTFTMEGERSEDPDISWENDPLSGIIPRAMNQLFARLDKMNCEYTVRVSFLEIYNEELIDLLGAESVENPRLKIYEDINKKGSHVIQGLEDVVVHNRSAVYSILERGTQRRQTAATLMNAHSSRSHSVFMVTIHMRENSVDGEELLKTGKLNLVDLAGSECIGRSGASDKRAREAGNINQSLLTLGRVITALVEHAPHIPYRESKLTRLLQDSLGGRTKTSIIATISPASNNIEETLSTLDYAHRAKNITNRPEINQKLTKKALLKEYTEEMERLRRDLQAARDKNGVFIAEENYNNMQSQILQQRDNIKELEEKIDVCNSEMYKLNELFTDTKEKLEETNKELETTTKNLEETTETLGKTRKNLARTRQDRDEQKHLVLQQVKTETKLYGQASQLLYTADAASSDVAGLHDKLDRKRAVESHNASAQESFRVQFRETVDDMESTLRSHTQGQLQGFQSLDNDLGSVVAKGADDLQTLKQEITDAKSSMNSQLAHIRQCQTDFTERTQQWTQQMIQVTNENKDKEICRQFELHESLMGVIAKTETMLSKVSCDLTKLQQDMHARAVEHQQMIQAFTDSHTEKLAHHKLLIQQYCEEQERTSSRQKQMIEDFKKSQEASNKNFIDELVKMATARSQNVVENFDTLLDDQSESEKQHKNLEKDLYSDTDKLTTDSHTGCANLKNNIEKMDSDLEENLNNKHQGYVTDLRSHKTSLEEVVTAMPEESREICTEVAAVCERMCNEHTEHTRAHLENYGAASEALSSSCGASMDEIVDKATSQQEDRARSVRSMNETVEQQRKQNIEWSERHHNALETQDKTVAQFLSEELRKDIPTGATPDRRGFSYPHSLTKTDRHSMLLQEFRSTYLLDEAMNVPLPEETFSEMPSVPVLNLDEVDDDQLPAENDGHNLSGDSAFETNSSTVSDGDKFGDSKENMMRPPSGIPLKSKSTSGKNSARSKSGNRERSKSGNRDTPTRGSKDNTPGKNEKTQRQTRLPLRAAHQNTSS